MILGAKRNISKLDLRTNRGFYCQNFPSENFGSKNAEADGLKDRPQVERIAGVEPVTSAWEANVLPINYIRSCGFYYK